MRNIKKYIAVLLICVFAIFTLVGCNTVNKSANYNGNATDNTFTLISSGSRMSIYKENVTDVMYVTYHAGYKGGLTVMLDTDGTPLLYSEWKDRLD
jgi:hypothetical protein